MALPRISTAILDDDVVAASANGILQCLRALADEASSLNLQLTRLAIQKAVSAALSENCANSNSVWRSRLH